MIRTLTLVRCDECPAELLGCDCIVNESRELTALAAARAEGWKRVPMGDHNLDLCPECYAAAVLAGRLPDPITPSETVRGPEAHPRRGVGSRV